MPIFREISQRPKPIVFLNQSPRLPTLSLSVVPMKSESSSRLTRRCFLATTAGAGALSLVGPSLAKPATAAGPPQAAATPTDAALEKVAAKPVLQTKNLNSPVNIESIELLRKGREHFVRVRSKDGAEGFRWTMAAWVCSTRF